MKVKESLTGFSVKESLTEVLRLNQKIKLTDHFSKKSLEF
jgi:hypothetical protein